MNSLINNTTKRNIFLLCFFFLYVLFVLGVSQSHKQDSKTFLIEQIEELCYEPKNVCDWT